MAKIPCLSLPLGGADRLTNLPQDLLVKIVVLVQSGRDILALSQASKDWKGAPWGAKWYNGNLRDSPNGGLDWRALIECDDSAECNPEENVAAVLQLQTHNLFLKSVKDICEKRPSFITIEEPRHSFAFQHDLPWDRLISNEAMQALFKCVTRLKIAKASHVNFMCFAIHSESLTNLKELDLNSNNIGDEGMTALSGAVTKGSLGGLKDLYLGSNRIGDAGTAALAGAIASGSLASLKTLNLDGNNIGDEGMKAFAAASGSMVNLKVLELGYNQIGDPGMSALAGAIASGSLPNLTELWLHYNQIGDAGMTELSRAIASGSLGALKELYLSGNKIGDAGMSAFAGAIASGSMANLRTLYLGKNNIGDAGMQALASVVNERLPKLSFCCMW